MLLIFSVYTAKYDNILFLTSRAETMSNCLREKRVTAVLLEGFVNIGKEKIR